MADTFVKVWSSMLDSSIWSETQATRIVWITMLVMADEHGFVGASIDGIARRANVSIDDARGAIEILSSPDPNSRSEEEDGRRIRKVDRGWHIINHGYFRELRDSESRKEYERKRKQEWRARQGDGDVPDTVPDTSRTKRDSYAYASASASEKDAWFAAFWDAYGLKVERKKARAIWDRLEPDEALRKRIGEAAARYRAACLTADHPQKHPTTWLNGECWEDEVLPKPKRNGKTVAAAGHIQNMPLGTPSCSCDGCVAFRARREGVA